MDWCARLSRCTTSGVEKKGTKSNGLRVVALSAISAFAAPLVFVGVIVLRKVERRANSQFQFWNKRFQHEISRWT
jgi:hypothetical protein